MRKSVGHQVNLFYLYFHFHLLINETTSNDSRKILISNQLAQQSSFGDFGWCWRVFIKFRFEHFGGFDKIFGGIQPFELVFINKCFFLLFNCLLLLPLALNLLLDHINNLGLVLLINPIPLCFNLPKPLTLTKVIIPPTFHHLLIAATIYRQVVRLDLLVVLLASGFVELWLYIVGTDLRIYGVLLHVLLL